MIVWCDCEGEYTRMKEIGSKMHQVSGMLYFKCPKCARMTQITEANRK